MKILVFTNCNKLKDVNVLTVHTLTKETNDLGNLLENNKFVFRENIVWKGCNEIPGTFPSDFILINDLIEFNIFKELIGSFDKNTEYYVVYHDNPKDEAFASYKKKSFWHKGTHISTNPIYVSIANAIVNAEGKTDKEIIENITVFYKKNIHNKIQKMKFLCEIYICEKKFETIESEFPDFTVLSEYTNLKSIISDSQPTKYSNENDNHYNALLALRDKIYSLE